MGGFSFGASQPQTQTLGTPQTSQLAGLLAQPTQNSGSTQGGFSFGGQPQSTAPSGGFSFGASLPKLSTPAASQPATTSMTLGASSAGAGFSFGGLSTQTTAAQQPLGGFSFGTPKVQASSAAPAQPTPALSLGAQPTGNNEEHNNPRITFFFFPVMLKLFVWFEPVFVCFVAAASTGATTGFSLALKTAASTAPATITSTSSTIVTSSTAPVMSYAQLEALINKWSSELEDQERHFLQQATQVNAWDRMLVENGEKITALHKDMEKVKLDQRRLDQELDFILSQQKELEDLLGPLEESVKEQSGTIYMQNADEERERTYKLAENVDAQLKRMSQDLKEIIEHLNTSSGPADTADPLQQICKILNAHMDSLQWVEQNSVLLQRRVEEVSKVCESRSKEQEKSFRLNFQ
uniref:Nucleoporin 62 like n=1 Tax=Cyprinus carpio TaxID=7962 RepID=A0A8C2FH89_CYPCA